MLVRAPPTLWLTNDMVDSRSRLRDSYWLTAHNTTTTELNPLAAPLHNHSYLGSQRRRHLIEGPCFSKLSME